MTRSRPYERSVIAPIIKEDIKYLTRRWVGHIPKYRRVCRQTKEPYTGRRGIREWTRLCVDPLSKIVIKNCTVPDQVVIRVTGINEKIVGKDGMILHVLSDIW